MSAGIDYGSGLTNINHETGIRYGCISQHSVSQMWCDCAEPDYGDATCHKCGSEAINSADLPEESEEWEIGEYACSDYGCLHCEYIFDASEAFGEEPQGWHYCEEGYELTDCLDSDIMVLTSPYYTLAPYCSPCVPGAGDLDNADESGVKTYCLGHSWFSEGRAPYPVYSVKTGLEIHPNT